MVGLATVPVVGVDDAAVAAVAVEVTIAGGETTVVPVRVSRQQPDGRAGSQPLQFVVKDLQDTDSRVSDASTFVSPAAR